MTHAHFIPLCWALVLACHPDSKVLSDGLFLAVVGCDLKPTDVWFSLTLLMTSLTALLPTSGGQPCCLLFIGEQRLKCLVSCFGGNRHVQQLVIQWLSLQFNHLNNDQSIMESFCLWHDSRSCRRTTDCQHSKDHRPIFWSSLVAVAAKMFCQGNPLAHLRLD